MRDEVSWRSSDHSRHRSAARSGEERTTPNRGLLDQRPSRQTKITWRRSEAFDERLGAEPGVVRAPEDRRAVLGERPSDALLDLGFRGRVDARVDAGEAEELLEERRRHTDPDVERLEPGVVGPPPLVDACASGIGIGRVSPRGGLTTGDRGGQRSVGTESGLQGAPASELRQLSVPDSDHRGRRGIGRGEDGDGATRGGQE